jgi:hypothetical protein
MKKIMTLFLSTLVIASLSGCAAFNYTKPTVQHNRTTTIGQELIDLQDAKDKGVVTDEEYNKLKKTDHEGWTDS